eukprot:gene12029-8282_t
MSDYSRLSPRSIRADESTVAESVGSRAGSCSSRRRVVICTPPRSSSAPTSPHGTRMGSRLPLVLRQAQPPEPRHPDAGGIRSRRRHLSLPHFEAPYGQFAVEKAHRQLSRQGDSPTSASPRQQSRPAAGYVVSTAVAAAPDVIPVSARRRLIPAPIRAEREPGMVKVSEVRPVPPQHMERMPFGSARWDPIPVKPRRKRETAEAAQPAPALSWLDRLRQGWRWLMEPEQRPDTVTPREERLAARIDAVPLLPVAVKRSLFDIINFFHDVFTSRLMLTVLLAILMAGSIYRLLLPGMSAVPILSRFSGAASNVFVAIDTEEGDRPGLSFFDKHNGGSAALPNRHPVVIFPGFITTGLEIWEANSTCLRRLKVNPSLRTWMLGPSMILLMLRDAACWLHLFSLDPESGLDRDGTRIRGGEGAAAVSQFVPGFWVWEKIIRNLADIGYDQSSIAVATYDWRLSPDLMQQRDGFYVRTKHLILQLYEQHQRPVAIIGHSYAIRVLVEFLQWTEEKENGFLNKYISHIVNVGGIALGAPKTLSATLFGDVQDTLTIPAALRSVLDRVMEPSQRYNFARTWSCLLAMLPHPCLDYDGGILKNEQDGSGLTTDEALDELRKECARTGHTNCVRRVQAHMEAAKKSLPFLPKARRTTMFCLYGINKPTEVGYHVTGSSAMALDPTAPHRGVHLGNGDGTVPLPSLGYMCRAPNGWKKDVGRVVTMEFPHDTSQASLLDFRGGRSSADHVDILGNHEVLDMILRIVSGVEERGGRVPLEDRIFSNIDDIIQSEAMSNILLFFLLFGFVQAFEVRGIGEGVAWGREWLPLVPCFAFSCVVTCPSRLATASLPYQIAEGGLFQSLSSLSPLLKRRCLGGSFCGQLRKLLMIRLVFQRAKVGSHRASFILKALTNPPRHSPVIEPQPASERPSLWGCQQHPPQDSFSYPSTILHPNSILRQPSAVRQHRRITKLSEVQTSSGEPATLQTRPESMRRGVNRRSPAAATDKRSPGVASCLPLNPITADVDCFQERITMKQGRHVPHPLGLPSIFPSCGCGQETALFRGPSAKRVVPRSVELAHLGQETACAKPICWEVRKREERLKQDVQDTCDLQDSEYPSEPTPEPDHKIVFGTIREMERAARNRQNQLWKLQMALQLIKRTSLYKLFVRMCDYRTRLQLIIREADFILKALENDMSPLQPPLVLGYHPLIWILSSGNTNFSYKDLSSPFMEGNEESSALSHYLRTQQDMSIFTILTEMVRGEKSGFAALLDAMFAVMTRPPMKPLDMAEFRQVMVNVSTELRHHISLMQIVLDRLQARVERRRKGQTKEMQGQEERRRAAATGAKDPEPEVKKEWTQTQAEFCTPHGTQAQLEGYHVPTEYEISLLLDAYTGALEDPTTTFTGVELKIEEVEVWFRFVKDFHVTGVSVLKVEHILESVAVVMAEVCAPVVLPDAAYEIFGYNGILSKQVEIEEVNLFGCPALKSTRLPEDPIKPGDLDGISSSKGSQRGKESPGDADLAHSLFALDVLGHDPLRVHHDLDFALEEIMQLLELASKICLERRAEDQRYREATCVGEKAKAEATAQLHAAWAKETAELLDYMRKAELRVANVHFIHSLLREHAPEMYKAFQEEHRTYLTGKPPSKKLETFTALVERYNPFPNRLVNSYLHSEVQKKYPKNFFIMAICHESYAQLKECENVVFWIMIKHYTAAVKAHKQKMRHNNRIPQTQSIPPKAALLIDHERIEHLTTPGYHLNERANPLLLPHCPKAVQILAWLDKLVRKPLRNYSLSVGSGPAIDPKNLGVSQSNLNLSARLREKKEEETARYGVMDCFIVTDYCRQLRDVVDSTSFLSLLSRCSIEPSLDHRITVVGDLALLVCCLKMHYSNARASSLLCLLLHLFPITTIGNRAMAGISRDIQEKKKKPTPWKRLRKALIDDTIVGGNPIIQQTMPGWYAYVSLKWIFPVYFILMVLFTSLGGFMLAKSVQGGKSTVHVTYSTVNNYQYIPDDPAVNVNQGILSFTVDGVEHKQGTVTWVNFNVKEKLVAPVYLYYGLEKFYQNFRTFNDGRSASQLRGVPQESWKTDPCVPFKEPGYLDDSGDTEMLVAGATVKAKDFVYNPCGSVPWSMFNDTFTLLRVSSNGGDPELVCNTSDFDPVGNPLGGSNGTNHCRKKGISWRADTEVRFAKLHKGPGIWSIDFPEKTSNPYLAHGWYLNEPGHRLPDPEDYDLQVWMRTAMLSRFHKLLRIIEEDLEPGDYLMRIEEFYDVTSFRGKKSFILLNVGPLGNGTRALAILLLVMGMVAFVIGVAFGIEACVKKSELFPHMPEPKRSWYVFDPTAPEFELYNALRIRRYVPVIELQALREKQAAKEGDVQGVLLGQGVEPVVHHRPDKLRRPNFLGTATIDI